MIDVRDVPVYYIGMPGERNARLERLFYSNNFKNFTKVPGIIDSNKKVAVAKAHMKALEIALRECDGPFIILEEDVELNHFSPEIRTLPNTDAIYLGISQWGLKDGRGQMKISVEPANNGFYRLNNMLAAHAVLYINHDYAQFLLDSIPIFIEMGTNQDKLRAETMKYWNIYTTRKPMFYQMGRYEKHTLFTLPGLNNLPLSSFYL